MKKLETLLAQIGNRSETVTGTVNPPVYFSTAYRHAGIGESTGFDYIRTGNPSPGNIRGGLTTLEEKSLGAAAKAGTRPLQELVEYAQRPTKKGLVWMDTPGHDIEQLTGMVAGGAQVVLFTSGRGTPTGSPIVPVIKIASNTRMFETMQENMDLNAGTVIDGTESVESVGKRIFEEILQVFQAS